VKTASLSLVLFLALISRSVSDEQPWRDYPVVISEQTLNNVIVVSNPNPYQVIVSIDGHTDLRIDTTQPIPRKLDPHEYVKLAEVLLRWPDTSKNRAEKKAGKYEKTQYLESQSGKHFKDVPITAITPLTPTPEATATPRATVNPI
jgi:hypothetical protein